MKLGTEVAVIKMLERKWTDRVVLEPPRKDWKEIETSERRGVYIGWRTLANGHCIYGGYDDQTHFKADSYIKAAMIVCHERQRPLFVPWSEIERNESK